MSERIGIAILGSTGSIGVSTLDVVRLHSEKYNVVALTANSNVEKMRQQVIEFDPQYAVMGCEASAKALREFLSSDCVNTEVLCGEHAFCDVVALDNVNCVMAAIVGGAGLLPTLSAVQAGKRVLLANKEALVMSGQLFMDAVKCSGAELLPIDSEHNAIFQCLPANSANSLEENGITRILLTGSGGPFRSTPLDVLSAVTPDQACAHPNWAMGRKISVDSATMMNKGLEFIEACWLFSARTDQIEIVLHPQSIIHSMVEYTDGSILAQLGNPDMRTPIAYGLGWPERIESGVSPLDLVKMGTLSFEEPDILRFPSLGLSRAVMDAGGSASIVMNAANEQAVASFLGKGIAFTQIIEIIERVLDNTQLVEPDSIESVLEADKQARELANQVIFKCVN